jgi:hypothetical protein
MPEMHMEMLVGFHVKCPYNCLILMNVRGCTNIKFYENPFNGSPVLHAERHTWWT